MGERKRNRGKRRGEGDRKVGERDKGTRRNDRER